MESEGRGRMNGDVAGCPRVLVMVGECLQLVTGSVFRAAVHRVRAPSTGPRVSCPLLVRGRASAKVGHCPRASGYRHPGGEEAVSALPDLSGLSMRLLHTLLDRKRAKCAELHRHSDDSDGQGEGEGQDWVLAAFPVVTG